MQKQTISITLAGIPLSCRLRYPESARYFSSVLSRRSLEPGSVAEITDEECAELEKLNMLVSPKTEASLLTAYVSEALMSFDRAIIHGVAVRWNDQAYLICANPGVGKSTQAKYLHELCPGEFGIICGDRPILEFRDDAIIVHPSPWNGKEGWHGADAAPLEGLILLERGEKNQLAAGYKNEVIPMVYSYFIQSGAREDAAARIAEMETKLLNSVQIWKLTTNTVPDSTKLLVETVFVKPDGRRSNDEI